MTRDLPLSALLTLPALVSMLTAACSDRVELQPKIVVHTSDSAGVTLVDLTGEVTDLPLWTVSGDPSLEVRGDGEPFVGSVGQVALLSDGRLLLEDDQNKALYRFDGTDFSTLGAEGDGPGEFRDISALSALAGDTVYAFDRRHLRFTVFSPTGDLVRTIAVAAEFTADGSTPRRAWALDASHLLVQAAGPLTVTDSPGTVQRDQRDVVLGTLDPLGADRSVRQRFEGGYTIRGMINGRGIIIVAPFANVPIVAPGSALVVHGSGVEYHLTVSSSDLEPDRIIRWSGWSQPVSDSLLQSARAQAEVRFADLLASNPESGDLVVDAMFTESLLPQVLPALGSVLVDDQGRIWVSKFRPSTDPWNQQDSWHVLEPDGTPLARVRLPAQARLVAVRNSSVVLVTLDELEVEHVRVVPLVHDGSRVEGNEP